MNGVRSTFMRRGYLLTALSALLLLAASTGTAEAQRVSIGFAETSGTVSEKAFLNANSLQEPQRVTIQVGGLLAGSRRTNDINNSIGTVTITSSQDVYIERVDSGRYVPVGTADTAGSSFTLEVAGSEDSTRHFDHSDEIVLVVSQSAIGTPDGNWLEEMIELKLSITGSASVGPDVYSLMVEESHVAPVAKFGQPDFKLSEQSTRTVDLDIHSGIRGLPLPGVGEGADFAGDDAAFPGMLSVRVSNHNLVRISTPTTRTTCPVRGQDPLYNRILFLVELDGDADSTVNWDAGNFSNTGVLTTAASIFDLASNTDNTQSGELQITGCGDGAGIRDPYITLEVMNNGVLSGRSSTTFAPTYGAIEAGPPLMVSIDSDEAGPTLSFSPTDVTIDEGGSVETVLLAEGPNANDVRTVKLMVEGDAMVDLYQGDEMLEEMNGYVMVDLGGNSSARLTAMSMESRELQDGDMAYKAWKLMDGAAEGVNIGDDYWFRVDVVGMTAVPALPLIGQLLLALFLMAGGSRLYRRRQG